MKRSNWVRLIAVILIISMLAAPVSAATNRGSDGVRTNGLVGTIVEIIRDIIRDIFDDWFDKPGDGEPVPTEPIETTAPTAPGETEPTEPGETEPGETKPTEPGETEPEETEPDESEPGETVPQVPETELSLIEGHDNTVNGHLLRAETYSLSQVIAQQTKPLTTANANHFGTKIGNSLGGNAVSSGLKPMAVNGGVQTMAEGDPVEITLEVGATHTINVNGDVSGDYSNDIVNVNAEFATTTTKTANLANHTTGLSNGNYLLVSANQLYRVNTGTKAVRTTLNSDSKLPCTNFDLNNIPADAIWTLEISEPASNGSMTGKIMTPDGKCLAYDGSKVTLADDTTVTIIRGTSTQFGDNLTNTWGVNFSGNNYLNYSNPVIRHSFDEGSHWCFYEVTEETITGTTITFTGASVGTTTVEIGGVTYNITVTMSPSNSYRDIPISVLTATAGDSQNGEDPDRVLDKNANTLWHTAYQGTSRDNHWIQFELSADYLVDGLRYQPRQNGTNGIITQYEVQVSEDGKTFRTVSSGNWDGNSSWKIAQFPGEHVKYVRLVSKNAVSDNSYKFASAAEIRLTGTPMLFDMVYFPVTMFDYDTNDMNVATHVLELQQARDAETNLALWNGLYFSDGSPASTYNGPTGEYIEGKTTVTYTLVVPEYDENGTITNLEPNTDYLLVNKRSHKAAKVNLEGTIAENAIIDGGNDIITGNPPTTHEIEFEAGTAVTEWGGGSLWQYVVQETDDGQTNTYIMSNGKYLTLQRTKAGLMENPTATVVQRRNGYPNGMVFRQGTECLSDYGGTGKSVFAGWHEGDEGDVFFVYKRVSETEQTPVTGNYNLNYANYNYFQKGPNQPGMANGDLFYTGLAGESLSENGNIMFNLPDAGIFSYDRSKLSAENEYYDGVKNVYEFVGMPFVLKDDKGYAQYIFDSDANGVYFKDTDGDGYSDPAPGTATEFNKLQFDPGVPQYLPFDVADGSRNGWFPYNIYIDRTDDGVNNPTYGTNSDEKQNLEYHFGMRADLPFSMTSNGRIKETDDNSDPIEFTFSGDDDVWIYIDGRLVADLGGLHNRFDITINFAENTVVYSEDNAADPNNETGSFNDPNFSTTQKLFSLTESDTDSLLGITRQEFASSENHTMQFFYLERGAGTSNCRIEFNLPMRDTLLVTKDATQSWSLKQDEDDGDDGDGTLDLSPSEQEAVNNINFGFTLMKLEGSYYDENGAPLVDAEFVPVANTNYFILNSGGQIVGHGSTNAEGHFFLKNGQTAKFMTDMPREGVTYYLVEDAVPDGFLTPDYQYKGVATQGFDYTGKTLDENENEITIDRTFVPNASLIPEQELHMEAEENKSYIVTAYGSIEAIDSLQFICVNYLEHLDTPAEAHANEDIIVIDYGLPVQIDPLANDIIRGEFVQSVDIVHVALNEQNFDADGDGMITAEEVAALNHAGNVTGHSGTFKFHDNTEGKNIVGNRDSFTYELNKQLTEVESLTYLVKVTAKESAVDGADTVDIYSQAKLYVVPATFMYYEENFNDMVKFTFNNGATAPTVMKEDAYVSPYQEPGVVGTIGDSTYGSDEAYKEDSHDSNGTSYFFDTTDGWVRFQYTFTGTGTTFFARTSATTGYMQVLLFKGDKVGASGEQIKTDYRDTYFYKDEQDYTKTHDDEPLYNIPVYTSDDLPYGTYTVLVTVATKGTKAAGPMDPTRNNMKYSMHEFYLDGIRVMQPLKGVYEEGAGELSPIDPDDRTPITNKALGAYATDGESNLEIATLRDKILEEFTPKYDAEGGETEPDWPFAVLTDTNKNIVKASEYKTTGPKEEVYLSAADAASGISNAQTVSFSLKLLEPDGLTLYMGMKAPFGSAQVKVGNKPQYLYNTTDYYYEVTDNFASRVTKYEQLCDENGQLLYTDPSGAQVYKSFDDDLCYYVDSGALVAEGTKLTPVDDPDQPYILVTYTFEAVDSIVSLTNIKIVGSYQFTILEDVDITDPGTNNGGNE